MPASLNLSSVYLELDPDRLEEPLFLQQKPGGKGLTDQPASAESCINSVEHLSVATGLPKMGFTAFRRDAGNMYGQQLGLSMAKTIMNHHEGHDVFREH